MIRRAALLSLLAAPAIAQEPSWSGAGMVPCDELAGAEFIAEPWEENSATFANGDIRVALLDGIEPAAAAYRLLILSPPYDEVGGRQCRMVGIPGGHGYGAIEFAARHASYDPETGLTLILPARQPDPDPAGDDGWFQLAVRINQQTGEIVTTGVE